MQVTQLQHTFLGRVSAGWIGNLDVVIRIIDIRELKVHAGYAVTATFLLLLLMGDCRCCCGTRAYPSSHGHGVDRPQTEVDCENMINSRKYAFLLRLFEAIHLLGVSSSPLCSRPF